MQYTHRLSRTIVHGHRTRDIATGYLCATHAERTHERIGHDFVGIFRVKGDSVVAQLDLLGDHVG